MWFKKGICLGILTADCAPVILLEMKKIIGAAHAGWNDFLHGVIENTIENMAQLRSKIGKYIESVKLYSKKL